MGKIYLQCDNSNITDQLGKISKPPGESKMGDFSKLPKWVQDHIRGLEIDRDNARKILASFLKKQKDSNI